MDSRELRSLQEAYLEVHQVDEAEKWIQKAIKKPGALSKQLGVPEDENIPAGKLAAAAKKGGKLGKRARLAMTLKGLRREEIDLYDTVFTHLLDEGYANTEEAAHKIIMNMSEEWTESILEMNDFAAGGGAAKMKATGMTKDQVVALGKKNLAAKPASSSSSGKSTGSTPPDAVRDRLASTEKYRKGLFKIPSKAERVKSAQDQEAKFDAYQKKQRESGYYKTGYKDLPGTFEKG